jgi:sugar lactone lactonase YvrE
MICEEQGDVMDLKKRIGGLYRFTVNDGLVLLKDNVGMGNGIVWNNTYNKMYFVDSYGLNIYEFDFDLKTGNICELT